MVGSIVTDPAYDTALAIIGMSGRFPGARDLQAFWQNITEGVISIQAFSEEELLAAGVEARLLHHPQYVKAGSVLQDIEYFDASFFGFTPEEAQCMDPQHRLFLECAWEALERAAYVPEHYKGLAGVFAASRNSDYLFSYLWPNQELLEASGAGMAQVTVSNDCDALASTVSYKLNLKGPAMTVRTFCSSSLVAVHLACQSLLTYECDMALAGGIALSLPQPGGYIYKEGGLFSPDGRCCAFDGSAQGSVPGNGVGVVALKRLKEALDDNDTIYAVIRGSSMNNDGGVRVGYTAPGLEGQSQVIADAITQSGVPFESIEYIETHGIGTRMGDTIELAALTRAFSPETQSRQFCALGSVKPNIGHLDRASGIAGLIKTVLALHHERIPPTLNFERTSSDIDLRQTPFYVNTTLREWKQTGADPRRAGVNSFGLGGTNVHMVLEEAPAREAGSPGRPYILLPLAARTESALQQMASNLAQHLVEHPELSLADVAYTLQVGRTSFQYRQALVCRNAAEAIEQLRAVKEQSTVQQIGKPRSIVLLFSDSAEDFSPGRACELYTQEPVFREAVEQCQAILQQRVQLDIGSLFQGKVQPDRSSDPALVACAAVVFQFALAQVWRSWGIQVQAVLGYKLGVYVAAILAEMCSLENVLSLVVEQARLAASVPVEDVARKHLADLLLHMERKTPKFPMLLQGSGDWITAAQVQDAGALATALSGPDQLSEGLEGLLTGKKYLLFEAGGKLVLDVPRQLYPRREQEQAVQEAGQARLLRGLGQLWQQGVLINWPGFAAHEHRLRVSLPTYPFERQRCWVEAKAARSLYDIEFGSLASKPSSFQQPVLTEEAACPTEAFHLPPPSVRPALANPYSAPENPTEEKIAAICGEILGIQQIGREDSFFALGGQSVTGTQLISRLCETFQVNLPLVTIFEASTVAALAIEVELLLLDEIEHMDEEETLLLLS